MASSSLLNEESFSVTESTLTSSSSSTVWGPGALAGKALKAFGEKGFDLFCRVVICRRLAFIKQTLEQNPHIFNDPTDANEWQRMNEMHADLKELCKDCYSLSLRRTAANLIRDITLIKQPIVDPTSEQETVQTQWEILLSHLLRPRGVLFETQEPVKIIGRQTPPNINQDFSQENPDATVHNGSDRSQLPNTPPGDRHIEVGVKVEENESPELATKYQTRKLGVFGPRIRRALPVSKLQDQKVVEIPHLKVLVLGAGGVGKSTLIRQFLLPEAVCFDPYLYRDIIRENVLASMISILRIDPYHDGSLEPWGSGPVADARELMFTSRSQTDEAMAIHYAWMVPEIRELARQPWEALLQCAALDSAEYFFDSASRIFASDYEPTRDDILWSRVCTSGIHEHLCMFNDFPVRLVDTGGEWSERKKWIHCFEDASAILFLVALPDYNRVLSETPSVNRMDDSLTLFREIWKTRWFTNTLISLVFTKGDVFENELKHAPLSNWSLDRPQMPNYDGKTYADACKYIENRFTDLIEDNDRPVHIYYTCTIDEAAMKDSCNVIKDDIVRHYKGRKKSSEESG